MTCIQPYIQTEEFIFPKQLTGNYVFEPLDLCCHKVSEQHVFVQAGGSQSAKDRKQKNPIGSLWNK